MPDEDMKELLGIAVKTVTDGMPNTHEAHIKRIGMRILFLILTDDEVITYSANGAIKEFGTEEVAEPRNRNKVSVLVDTNMLEALEWVGAQLRQRVNTLEDDDA